MYKLYKITYNDGYAEGTDTLLGIIEECTNTLGYGIEISVSEISKEEYEKIKENEDDEGGAYDRLQSFIKYT